MASALRIGRLALATLLVLVAAWFFWPTPLGGRTTYVTTHGVSMEPRFSTGDLAILLPEPRYSVGDVVAYSSPTLKTTVMHRLIARNGDSFTTQGDNNSWTDPDHPTAAQIQGKLWLRIPQGGKALATLRSPAVLAIISAAAVVLVGAVSRPRRRHASPRRRADRGRISTPTFSTPARARARQAATVLAVGTLLAGAAEAVLLMLPATRADAHTAQVLQQGRFAYSGTATAGTTYPTGTLSTGDPIYTKLITGLTVSFTDVVTGADSVRGTVRLDVSLATADGWHASLGSGPAAPIAGRTATASVALYPAAATQLIARHNAEIGASATGATLTVTPVVDLSGTAGGRPFTAAAPKGVSFALDATVLRPAGSDAAALTPALSTAVTVPGLADRSFTVRGITIPLPVARLVAALVLWAAFLGLGIAYWIGRSRSGDAADEFTVRHGARILEVTEFSPGAVVIDVAEPEALHRVAERLDCLVLHRAGEDADTFAVQDGDTTYRCVIPARRGPATTSSRRRSGLRRRRP